MSRSRWHKFLLTGLCCLLSAQGLACGSPTEPVDPTPPPPVDSRTEVTRSALIEKMTTSIYTDNIKSEETFAGLSDPSQVGVDRERFDSEVLYPLPAEAEFAEVYNVLDYELSPQATDNAPAFKLLVGRLKAREGKKKVFFPKGVYRFGETIDFVEIDDVYLAGEEGTEWIVTDWTTILHVNKCDNFHINDIDFDYSPSSTVSGDVVAADAAKRTVTVRIDEEFDMTDRRFTGGKIDRGNYMEYVWDEENDCYYPDRDGMLRYNSPGDSSYGIEDGSYNAATRELTVTFNTSQGSFRAPQPGKRVSLAYTMYEYAGFLVEWCKNYTMESCNLYAALGMAFVTYNDENVYLNRTNLMLRPGSKRLMTATADGLHANGCYGEMKVTNSIYEASHDDAMNICSFYNTVSSVSGNVIMCAASSQTTNYPICDGDQIEIYDPDTFEVIASYTAVSVDQYSISYEVTCDRRVTNKVTAGCYVGNTTRVPALTVDNCVIRNKRNRGILGQVRNSVVTNCAFYHVIHGPIMLNASKDIFAEAIVPRDITVKNCKFWDNNAGYGLNADVSAMRTGGTVVPGSITGIVVENNFFANTANAGVYFSGTGKCRANNNLFWNPAVLPQSDNHRCAVWLNIDEDATVKDNCILLPDPSADFTAVRLTRATGTSQKNNVCETQGGSV